MSSETMSNVSDNPTPLASVDLSAPIKTVQDTAADFSTDIIKWMSQSTSHALLALCAVIGAGLALALLRSVLMRLAKGKGELPRRGVRITIYRLIKNTSVLFLLVLGSWGISQFINLPRGVDKGLELALLLSGFFQIGLMVREIVLLVIERRLWRGQYSDQPVSNALGVIGWLVNLIVWSVTILVLLDNMGVNVTALMAGLGIGGLAIGLAAQGVISDLFSALSIVFDRPFTRGDFIVFGDKRGTVERIGLKTSRIRALSGEMIVVANNKLLGEVIHNHQQLQERRMVFTLGVSYDTTPEQLEEVQQIIKDAIMAQNLCRFDRAHMIGLGESALNFEAVYFFLGKEYNPCMDAHQTILLRIMRELAARNIAFAYPTQTVYLKRG